MNKDQSPFTPGIPVPLDYFIGRIKEIERLQRAIRAASVGRNMNVFITGERGIGKSSLAGFGRYLAQKEYGFVGAHCYLGTAQSVEDVTRVIFHRLLREMPEKSLFENARDVLGRYIKSVDLFGMNIEFTRDRDDLEDLKLNFLPILHQVFNAIEEERKGVYLALDDLDGVVRVPEFAYFLKSLVDEMATSERLAIPLVLILVGVEERIADLGDIHASVPRIFDVVHLSPMSVEESAEFFKKAFASVGMKLDDDGLDTLVYFSGNLPVLLHEVGDATFWHDDDGVIDENDAFAGAILAAENVGRKYLDPQVYKSMRSKAYLSFIRTIATMEPFRIGFKRAVVLREIADGEKSKFDNFLRKMVSIGVLKKGEERGEYIFANHLYMVYALLEARRAEEEA